MGASDQIRVSSEIKEVLESQKRDDESYNDVIERLLRERTEWRQEAIREGAGLWEGTAAAEKAKAVRASMKDEIGPDR